jgi:hypothetical protein
MPILLAVVVPLIILLAWGVVVDLKRRRRRAALGSHDIGSAARSARASAEARGLPPT